MSINKVVLTGNLTRDAELQYTQSGMAISAIGLAVNERAKNSATGEWEDYANFINCKMFGKRAESLDPYLKKGQKVAVDGKLHYSSWEKDGQKRNKIEVIVNDLELLGGAKQQSQEQGATEETVTNEEIPF